MLAIRSCFRQSISSFLILRFISTETEYLKQEINKAREWLDTFNYEKIPRNYFDISFSRSSGPGGQKVNKTSSKATVALSSDRWLNPQFCYWIPAPVRTQLQHNPVRYQTKVGGLLVQSDSSRNREDNTDECFRKLLREIKDKTFFVAEVSEEDQKRWNEIRKQTNEKRLLEKKKHSDKKKLRSKAFDKNSINY
ncbi:uncharacterized protein KQ657_003670 [Scheffersomyces spartinae]|uniref:Prokaryotic-type class I peptide chain release factors domain-containing protein n=1 Tax=Scheffersomyces spartinae TaxID=45513 RepID=A0A9P8AJR4_9ASCO|nr:uncharacterized protein KQ657_003670 [Scheffersomyces spartinae]KAG7195149.1 hypothetical protein KQ657_003670 [Scheffersomyces spartinae]